MWMQAGGSLEEAESDEYPYQELHQRLKSWIVKHDIFKSLLLHFDGHIALDTRREMLDELAADMEKPEIRAFIITQFRSRYLPDCASLEFLRFYPKYADIVSAIEQGRRDNKPLPLQMQTL